MKKRAISLLLALSMVLTLLAQAVPFAVSAQEQGIYSVNAPTEDLKIEFWLDAGGTPWYQVVRNGKELIEDSKLGFNTSLGDLGTGLSLVDEPVTASGDSTWEPVIGEQAQIRDRWNEITFTLSRGELVFRIVMRAYDEGVAFRYVLPQNDSSYTVSDEYTQFVFQAGAKASLHYSGNQTVPREHAVESLPSGPVQRPATVEFTDGQILTICEADLENFSVMTMSRSSTARAFEADLYSAVTVTADGPAESPWRVLVMGDEPADLLENDTVIQNLNEPADEETYNFSEWVDPGTCVRATTGLNNTAIKGVVDLAAEHGIRYVLLDSGWYGPEQDPNADPRLDPAALDPENDKDKILLEKYFATEGGYNNTGEGVFNTNGIGFNQYGSLGDGGSLQVNVDIPELCEYANARGVGIILYVNKVFLPDATGRNRFTVDELFAYYEKWGVAGVKPGFVNVRSQKNEAYMEEVIEAAAKHRLVMTVHDEYVTTGQERTYPNLMMTEGILGDEGIGRSSPQAAEDITTIFTRNVQGPPDHTFCYPGKATKAYALASPILFRSGMSVIYWYTNPGMVPAQDKDRLAIWDDMPTNWDKSLFLEGSLYEYATTARKAAGTDTWYVGSLSAVTRTLELPLAFLDEGVTYVAEIYADGVDADPYAGWTTSATAAKSLQTLEIRKVLVDSETVLQRDLKYGFGYAVVLTPATQDETASLAAYSLARQELELEIARCEGITAGNYTSDSFAAYEEAYAAAQSASADDNATDEALQTALDELKAARLALVTTEALMAAIADTAYYTSYHFTESSFAALREAVTAAQALLDSGNFTQEDLDEAEAAITKAVEDLIEDPNRVLKKTTYLDELNYDTGRSYAHAGAIKKKTDYYGSTLSLMVDGAEKIFERGVSTHAQSELYYNIEGMNLQTFEAWVGVDTAKTTQGNVIFRVYGDGVLLYESEASGNGSQNAQHFSIPIAGVKELHMEANMAGSNDGDHAVWGDAKFLTYQDPNAWLTAITVDSEKLAGYDQGTCEYLSYAPDPARIPVVEGILAAEDLSCTVKQAQSIPGCAEIAVTRRDGSVVTYRVYLLSAEDSDYISDLPDSLIVDNTLYALNKDSCQGNKLALTAEDGTSRIDYTKGLGTHAKTGTTSHVVYNIEGRGYDRFEGYVGISYLKNDNRSTVNFKLYVDDETTPRFESGKMGYRDPAIYYNVDVSGARTLTLVADACGDQSADHGCWCDAKFLKYTGVQTVSGTVDVNNTGLEKAGIEVNLCAAEREDTKTVLTDENGAYSFANVLAGEYQIEVTQGENNLAAFAQIQVGEEAVIQDLILQAPEYEIEIVQPRDAIVMVDYSTAVRDDRITVFVKDITPGKRVEEIKVTAEDGAQISVTEAGGDYTFTMPAQNVTVRVVLADDEGYAADLAAAQAVDEKILAVEEVTLETKVQIEQIRAAYEALSDSAKAYVKELDLLEHYEYLLKNMEILQAAEVAQKAAQEAREKAEQAKDDAVTAKDAAELALDDAEAAKEAAVDAQNNAIAAEAAAREAAENAGKDAQAAKAAQTAAEQAKDLAIAAQEKAEQAEADALTAKTNAETAEANAKTAESNAKTAQSAAETAANAAEQSNLAAAQEAAAAAKSALTAAEESAKAAAENAKAAKQAEAAAASAKAAAESATESAGYANDAAQSAKDAQIAQKAAEDAQAAAEAAQKAAEEERLAAEEAQKAAEEERLAAQEAQKAAEEAQKAAEEERKAAQEAKDAAESAKIAAEEAALNGAKYQAALNLDSYAQKVDQTGYDAEQIKVFAQIVSEAKAAIAAAESIDEVQKCLDEAKTAVDAVEDLCASNAYTDVAKDAWYHEYVDYMVEKGYMNGVSDTRFDVDGSVTRAQLVTILYRVAGEPSVAGLDNPFKDVEQDQWYTDAIVWAASEGVVNGVSKNEFAPGKKITREQIVTILYRYDGEQKQETDHLADFTDAGKIADYAVDAMNWAVGQGVMNGVNATTLAPADTATRAQICAIVMRYLEK